MDKNLLTQSLFGLINVFSFGKCFLFCKFAIIVNLLIAYRFKEKFTL